ncbi:MAG: M4 family metallopeptidase [Bacteroidales bacterium]|nr:M4 family metallopeptidase [Bacteroidales bacterium]
MKKNYFLLIVAVMFFLFGNQAFTQKAENPFSVKKKATPKSNGPKVPVAKVLKITETDQGSRSAENYDYKGIPFRHTLDNSSFINSKYEKNGLLMFVEGTPETGADFSGRNKESVVRAAYAYLKPLAQAMQIDNVDSEFTSMKVWSDEINFTHIKMQQVFKGLKVYGGQIILHGSGGFLTKFNGTYFPTPQISALNPELQMASAVDIAFADVAKTSIIAEVNSFNIEQLEYEKAVSELVIYHHDRDINSEKLAWHITLRPNFLERWEYFVDAQTGEIINKYNNTCADGPATANATDLNGVNRTINTYLSNGTYYMLNTTLPMFKPGQGEIPDNPVGAILTLNANNTNNENITHVSSSNNSWADASSVSAHYNGSLTYNYYRNTHGRNSINGEGGTIISVVNVADQNGQSLANAYWNGKAMFYGNGGNQFYPLAGGLDVAAHEMTHGVIQNTANLEYQYEPGAINESMADISGAMVDRSNWQIGETITPDDNPNFPTGTMRDMANPHNGGSSFSDPSYQPKHTNEKYTGSQDNGGVHINSGIINYAYYLLAEDISKNKAEKLFYRALSSYMTKSSQFIDCRLAFEQAAKDIYGNNSAEHNAVANAFYSVGIGEAAPGGGGGSGSPGEIEVNPGQDYILSYDVNPNDQNTLYISSTSGTNFIPISTTKLKRRPSLVDNGSVGVMVTEGSEMKTIEMTSPYDETVISPDVIWDNVAVSKDGMRIAAITTDIDSAIWVYDFNKAQWAKYHLYSPTFTEGVVVDNVLYADAIEWDFTGQYLVYDAYNKLQNNSGQDIDYWDVGFIKVWDNNNNNWGDGDIFKLFTGLAEGVSIGNPSFSKNTPFILAFDYFDSNDGDTKIMGANLETGDVNTIFDNAILGFPSYSKLDNKIVFSALNSTGGEVAGVIDLNDDKISPSGGASVLISDAKWPVWYATGNRDLMDVEENGFDENIFTNVFPNPANNQLNISINTENAETFEINIYNIYGQLLVEEMGTTNSSITHKVIDISKLSNGTFVVNININGRNFNHKIVKVD